MEVSSSDSALLNVYVQQHELYILINQLGTAVDQLEENIILLRSDHLDGNGRKVQLNRSSVRCSKLAASLLFQIAATDTVPKKAVRTLSLRYHDVSMSSTTRTQSGEMRRRHLDGLKPVILQPDFPTRETWLLREVVHVIALRCRNLLLGDNISCMDGALHWAEQVQTSPRLGVALAFAVVTAWRRIASLGVSFASIRDEHYHASPLNETNTAHGHAVASRNAGCVDGILFFCALCSSSGPPCPLSNFSGNSRKDPVNDDAVGDLGAFFDPELLKDFALAIFRGHCRNMPLDVWNGFLSTAQFTTYLLEEIKIRQGKSNDYFSHFPLTLAQEAIVLRSLLLFTTGQSHVWASALLSASLSSTEVGFGTLLVENVPEEVCLDVRRIFDELNAFVNKEVKNNELILFSSLVLSDGYALWLLQPYATMWSCYCTLYEGNE
ncbi:unnamed protein product [Phytomonas sp. EM1]|nr:unnamed protein product [Phytomonas sp. EM1]|eukprot:CCW61439.1 unnamed protein product [Phytomonas sp. isolate EM1]